MTQNSNTTLRTELHRISNLAMAIERLAAFVPNDCLEGPLAEIAMQARALYRAYIERASLSAGFPVDKRLANTGPVRPPPCREVGGHQ